MRKSKNSVTQEIAALSLEQCLAKTYADQQQGRKVTEHCQIVGEVAKELIVRMPPWLRADLFPKGAELIAACHDLGKVSPTFQVIKQALDDAGFVKPQLHADLSFSQVFGFEPRAIQQTLIASSSKAGVYVLEAPMGIGKTEAALYAAYKLLSDGKANGIYFALPTQLTSDKIHERMNRFLEAILVPKSPHREALLVHGNAWLKRIMAARWLMVSGRRTWHSRPVCSGHNRPSINGSDVG